MIACDYKTRSLKTMCVKYYTDRIMDISYKHGTCFVEILIHKPAMLHSHTLKKIGVRNNTTV